MGPLDFVLLALILLAAGFALRKVIRSKGSCGCGGSCAHCSGNCAACGTRGACEKKKEQ